MDNLVSVTAKSRGLDKAFRYSDSRRSFLKQATGCLIAASSTGVAWAGSANDRLNVASIGLGGMGNGHLDWLLGRQDVRVTALADVDATRLAAAHVKVPTALSTGDFRQVVDREDVDAVVIATPDHWHGLIAIAAARAGKQVYCEKPLTNSIGEGRAVADAVRKAGVVLQTGSHERSNSGATIAKQLISQGKLGEIHTVRIHLPNSDKHLQEVENFTNPPDDSTPPAGFDDEFWLGPAAVSPYNERRRHFWWRFHNAYGGGEMTDRGAHVIDLAHMILGLDNTGPVRIEARGERPRGGFFDAFITFDFENRYKSGLRMIGSNQGPRGVSFEGSEGKLFVAVHGCRLTAEPASLLEGIKSIGVNPYDQHRNGWVEAIRGGDPVIAPAEAGHRTASVCHLNNLALRTGLSFDWDPITEQTSEPEVNALLTPTMRPPWSLG